MKTFHEWLKIREGMDMNKLAQSSQAPSNSGGNYYNQFGDNWNNGKGQAADIDAREREKNTMTREKWEQGYNAQVAADKARTPRPTNDMAAWNKNYQAQQNAEKKQDDRYANTSHNLASGNYQDTADHYKYGGHVPDYAYNNFGTVPDQQLDASQLMQKNMGSIRGRLEPRGPLFQPNSPANKMWQNQGLTPAADRAKIYAQQGKTDQLQPWEQNPTPHPYMKK